jgi:tetratricopeptide (TPR) repeat protein
MKARPTPEQRTETLVRESLLAVGEIVARSHAVHGWELLQERSSEGDALGALPYTDEAIREFHAALTLFPDSPQVLHHLAIAHHARAWDLELQGDSRAAREWELALGYWRRLVASGEFWVEQTRKLQACDAKASPAVLELARRDVLENLLDIHVDFIRHYCELGQMSRATEHIAIIRRARIPPVVANRLLERVFEAMTASVSQASQAHEYDSGLVPLEQFLGLFPGRPLLVALRKHVELCTAWLLRLSCQTDWEAIVQLSRRAWPVAQRLASHPQLEHQAMAKAALEQLTGEMVLRGYDRAVTYMTKLNTKEVAAQDWWDAGDALQFSLDWGRLGYERARASSVVHQLLPVCVNLRSLYLQHAAQEEYERLRRLMEGAVGTDVRQMEHLRHEVLKRAGVSVDLLRQAVADLNEAIGYDPYDQILAQNRDRAQAQLNDLEFFLKDLPGGPL